MENKGNKCPECRHKVRDEDERKLLINRINRIEGQIGGIRRMVESDTYCPDILVQISAASSALASLSKLLLTNHIKTCVLEDIMAGEQGAADELAQLITKLTR